MRFAAWEGCHHMERMNRFDRFRLFSWKYCAEWILRIKNEAVKRFMVVLASPVTAVRHFSILKNVLRADEVLPYVEVFLTCRCSLRCAYCDSLIPSYPKGYDVPLDMLKKELKGFLDNVDHIRTLRLLGGETFLYPHLAEAVEFLTTYENIEDVVLVTNGTIVPKDERLINAMRHPRVGIYISNYGELSAKAQELIALGRERGIRVTLSPQFDWYEPNTDYGDKHLSEQALMDKFSDCNETCRLIRDGKLFFCRHAFMVEHTPGAEHDPNDFIDLLQPDATTHRRILDLFFERKYLTGCRYCPGSRIHMELSLPGGQQLEPGREQPMPRPAALDAIQAEEI